MLQYWTHMILILMKKVGKFKLVFGTKAKLLNPYFTIVKCKYKF